MPRPVYRKYIGEFNQNITVPGILYYIILVVRGPVNVPRSYFLDYVNKYPVTSLGKKWKGLVFPFRRSLFLLTDESCFTKIGRQLLLFSTDKHSNHPELCSVRLLLWYALHHNTCIKTAKLTDQMSLLVQFLVLSGCVSAGDSRLRQTSRQLPSQTKFGLFSTRDYQTYQQRLVTSTP